MQRACSVGIIFTIFKMYLKLSYAKMAAILADDNFKYIFVNSDSSFTEICSQASHWKLAGICLAYGLAPNRRQAITCTNADPVHWRLYATQGGTALKGKTPCRLPLIFNFCSWVLTVKIVPQGNPVSRPWLRLLQEAVVERKVW